MYNFKNVLADVSAEGEWLYMLDDREGTVVDFFDLWIGDEEDEEVARAYGLTDEEIEHLRVKTN